ncbi:jg5677 [Pararge aegeria aegeria]|uniref:Jg5677 protein n=1 Tax=Pararge aegeria aegeria TaxID=348720 RepID=A0A8S4RN73_9NEOP|nr:jg5677 [Pararge aegeria aegeria]
MAIKEASEKEKEHVADALPIRRRRTGGRRRRYAHLAHVLVGILADALASESHIPYWRYSFDCVASGRAKRISQRQKKRGQKA